jgi:hypothetical protein
MTSPEPIADELGLQNSLAAGSRNAATGGIHKVAIGDGVFHQFFDGDFFPSVGIPGITVVAIQAAHQAALEENDKADPWAIYGATGFEGVDATCH